MLCALVGLGLLLVSVTSVQTMDMDDEQLEMDKRYAGQLSRSIFGPQKKYAGALQRTIFKDIDQKRYAGAFGRSLFSKQQRNPGAQMAFLPQHKRYAGALHASIFAPVEEKRYAGAFHQSMYREPSERARFRSLMERWREMCVRRDQWGVGALPGYDRYALNIIP